MTNGFVQAILPDALPDGEDQARVLEILRIEPDHLTCCYCGQVASHWDHLNSYVRDRRPSGYLNEANNRVPDCGPCNTSKGNRHWRDWMFGPARNSPKSRNVQDLEERARRLSALEEEIGLAPHNLAKIVGDDDWRAYWAKLAQIEALMRAAQREAEEIKGKITRRLAGS